MPIFIHHGSATLEIRCNAQAVEASSLSEIDQKIEDLMNFSQSYSLLNTQDEKTTLAQISNRFQWIEAAGGIIKNKKGELLLIHRRGHWDLPKGKINAGETPLIAAIREIAEETGLTHLKKMDDCEPTFHVYRMKEKWFIKKTHWFVFELETEQELVLQTEEDITAARWMNQTEIRLVWKEIYPSLQPLLATVID